MLTMIALTAALPTAAGDWPHFRGPDHNGISQERGLVRSWSEDGPRQIWRRQIGDGFSGISLADGALFTADGNEQGEFLIKSDPASGRELWRRRIAATFEDSWGNGPRSTPTVSGDLVVILSSDGQLVAMSSADGSLRWSHDLKQEYGVEIPEWGFAASPVVVGERVIVEIGASEQRSVVAFDRGSGKQLWATGDGGSAYGSPLPVEIGEREQLLFLNRTGLIAVSSEGEMIWRFGWQESGIKPANPVFVAPDLVMISAAYGVGAAALRLSNGEDGYSIDELWQDRHLMRNHFSSSLAVGGYVYGMDNATLKCIDPRAGKQVWAKRGGLGKGSLIAADGMLILLTETGTLKLIEATPEAYRELASAKLFEGRCWTAPSLADGILYLRNQEEMVSLDMRQRDGAAVAAAKTGP
jgi:outer membrane protein assembly factor BamB